MAELSPKGKQALGGAWDSHDTSNNAEKVHIACVEAICYELAELREVLSEIRDRLEPDVELP